MHPGANPGKALISTALEPVWKIIFLSHKRTGSGVPTGSFSRKRDVDVNRLLATRSLEGLEISNKLIRTLTN